MTRSLSRPALRQRAMPCLVATLGMLALSPSSGQRLPGLVQVPEATVAPPAALQAPSTPKAPPLAANTKAAPSVPKAPRPTAPAKEPSEQEERRSSEQWFAQLNEAAASGEIVYLARLLKTADHEKNFAAAKPGLGKARDAGSKLASFLYAAFDYNTAPDSSVEKTKAADAIKAMKGYPAADHWLAARGIVPATTDYDTQRKNAEAVMLNLPSGLSASADYVRALARCRALDWRACMAQLQAPSLQDDPLAQATRGMVHLTDGTGFYNLAQARTLLSTALPVLVRQDHDSPSSNYALALAWITQQGLGGATDPSAAESFFKNSRRTPSATLGTSIGLAGQRCGQLEYRGDIWKTIPVFGTEGGLRNFAHVIKPTAGTDWVQAVASCRAKAEAGDADAMAFMGDVLLRNCPGGPNDKQCDRKEGAAWLVKAAQGGSAYGAYATVLRAKDDLTAARKALAEAKFKADTQLAARYTIAKADAKTPAQEYESIARELQNLPDFWKSGSGWAQAMLVQMVREKKVPASYQGAALRAYATYLGLLNESGAFKSIVLTTNLNGIDWLQASPNDKNALLDDEFRYAQLMAACGAWEYGKTRSCPYVRDWRRPHSMAVKTGEPPKRVSDRWLGEWLLTSSGTLQAPATHLEWMPCALGQTWDGTQQRCKGDRVNKDNKSAAATVQAFNTAGGFGGHSDWRLPTVDELHTIAHCRGSTQSTLRIPSGVVVPKTCIKPNYSGEQDVRLDLFPDTPYSLLATRPGRKDSLMQVYMHEEFEASPLAKWDLLNAPVLLVRGMK